MSYQYPTDPKVEESTNRVMMWGAGLLAAMVLAFPFYRLYEPSGREEARALQFQSLAAQGEQIYSINCAACHGLNGEGGIGPALNSQQFLQATSDEQTRTLIAVGVPGSQMSAYSLDYGGPLTSEQIKAVSTFIHTWEDDAPDRPDWRAMLGG